MSSLLADTATADNFEVHGPKKHSFFILVSWLAITLSGACVPSTGGTDIPCRNNAQCPTGYSCSAEGRCVEGSSGVSGAQLLLQPSSLTLKAGSAQQFSATVDAEATTDVTWTVVGPGSISPAGMYSPPAEVESPVEVTIQAVHNSEPSLTASALVILIPTSQNLAPVTLSVEPGSLSVGGSTTSLKVHGTGFTPSSVVRAGEVSLTTTFESASRLVAELPASLVQTAAELQITVVTPTPGGGTSNVQTVAVRNPLPAITSLSPSQVSIGAATFVMTVDGASFVPSSVAHLDGTALSTQWVSATRLQATVPASLLTSGRAAAVDVRTPGPGGGRSVDALLNVNNPPASTGSVSPESVLAGSGEAALTLTGGDFKAGLTVEVDGQPLPAQRVSDTQATVTLPASMVAVSRTYQLKVVNRGPGGGGLNTLPFRVSPVLQTVAGAGSTEGNAASSVQLSLPNWEWGANAVAMHPLTSELYYTDTGRHQVMRIDAEGTVRRVAGTGYCNTRGEGGPAVDADICSPHGLVFDPNGNLFLFSRGKQRLYRIDAAEPRTLSVVTTSSVFDEAGAMALNPVTQKLHLSVCYGGSARDHRIHVVDGSTLSVVAGNGEDTHAGDGGAATSASISCPAGIAFDGSGTLYIAEQGRHRIRKVDTAGIISTIAGTGTSGHTGDGGLATSAQIASPNGLFVDEQGEIYFSQYTRQTLRKIGTNGIITAVAGVYSDGPASPSGTPAATARLGHVAGILRGPGGELHFNTGRYWGGDLLAIKRIDGAGQVQVVAGRMFQTMAASDSYVPHPGGLTMDAGGNLYVASMTQNQIYRIDTAGIMKVVAGSGVAGFCGDGGPATQACLSVPAGLWIDAAGNLYFADRENDRVRKVDTQGVISTIAGGGVWPAGCPSGSPTSPPPTAGPGYNCVGDDHLATQAKLVLPQSVVGDNAGALYFSEGTAPSTSSAPGNGNRVRKLDLVTGIITTVAGSTDPSTSTCGFSGDGGQAASAWLCDVRGLTLDPQGDLIVSDKGNSRLRKIRLKTAHSGVIVTIAGNGTKATTGDGGMATTASLNVPNGISFDTSGNLYVADESGDNIRRIAPTGIITTIAGSTTGHEGQSPDGTEPRSARLMTPMFLAISPDGSTLYFSEYDNHRIRRFGL